MAVAGVGDVVAGRNPRVDDRPAGSRLLLQQRHGAGRAAPQVFVVEALALAVDPQVALQAAADQPAQAVRVLVVRRGVGVHPDRVHVHELGPNALQDLVALAQRAIAAAQQDPAARGEVRGVLSDHLRVVVEAAGSDQDRLGAAFARALGPFGQQADHSPRRHDQVG